MKSESDLIKDSKLSDSLLKNKRFEKILQIDLNKIEKYSNKCQRSLNRKEFEFSARMRDKQAVKKHQMSETRLEKLKLNSVTDSTLYYHNKNKLDSALLLIRKKDYDTNTKLPKIDETLLKEKKTLKSLNSILNCKPKLQQIKIQQNIVQHPKDDLTSSKSIVYSLNVQNSSFKPTFSVRMTTSTPIDNHETTKKTFSFRNLKTNALNDKRFIDLVLSLKD